MTELRLEARPSRAATFERRTTETAVQAEVWLDGTGVASIDTGIGMLDHLWNQLARHSGVDLTLNCRGDLFVDDHHTAEDSAIAVGRAFRTALGERTGIRRFGSAYAPLDESLARAVVDLVDRPWAEIRLDLKRERLGELSTENIPHVLRSFATAAGMTLHIDVLRGENDHHRAEAAFKALALALREALQTTGDRRSPSTKETLA